MQILSQCFGGFLKHTNFQIKNKKQAETYNQFRKRKNLMYLTDVNLYYLYLFEIFHFKVIITESAALKQDLKEQIIGTTGKTMERLERVGIYPNIYKWLRMIKGLCLIHKRRMDCSLNVGKTD